MKRGYFGKENKDADYGFAIVANTAKQAKKLLYELRHEYGEGEWNWIDLTIEWKRDAIVDDIPIGQIEDLRIGLESKIFSFVCGADCDVCGNEGEYIQLVNNKMMCEECIEGFGMITNA